MQREQMRLFAEVGVVGSVQLVGENDFAEVNDQGCLVIPPGVEPKGFHLLAAVEEDGRTFVVQKVVGNEGGGYESLALSVFKKFAKGFKATIMRDPIDVIRAGSNVWTGWHKNAASNRVDCWHLGKDGKLDLFQMGVKTSDNGKTWKLHGEYRWRGQLYVRGNRKVQGQLVGKPEHSRWGSLEAGSSQRTQIFHHPEFQSLLQDAKLPMWKGTDAELDPVLPDVPAGDFAVIDWYISFAGQNGQGIAKDRKGNSAWVLSSDIEGVAPDADGEIRLWHGDIVSFGGVVHNWGKKQGGPPKLTGVKLVKREW